MLAGQTDIRYIRKFNMISNKDSVLKKQGENMITAAKRQTSINPLYPSGNFIYHIVKVKDFRNRPGVAQRVPGGLGSQISMTFGT
jgi:hypothetical protein